MSSNASTGCKLSLMLCYLLNINSLRVMWVFEVGSADGRVSHFLSHAYGIVCIGIEYCNSAFVRNMDACNKMISSSESSGKMIPVTFKGDFIKMRSRAVTESFLDKCNALVRTLSPGCLMRLT